MNPYDGLQPFLSTSVSYGCKHCKHKQSNVTSQGSRIELDLFVKLSLRQYESFKHALDDSCVSSVPKRVYCSYAVLVVVAIDVLGLAP